MKKLVLFFSYYLLLTTCHSFAQVQWASKLIDFSSEYKEGLPENSTRYSAKQVLGYPNTMKYGKTGLAWATSKSQAGTEFITVGFSTPQTVAQVIVGEVLNSGSIKEIILYDNNGKKYTVYENNNPTRTEKLFDVLTYFKVKTTYNVVKLKLILNTDAVTGMQQIDCIGISSATTPYVQNINVIKYSETVGQPENLGPTVNSAYYDHLPLISPDGSMLYFTRKFADDNLGKEHKDDIYFSTILPTGRFSKAENIGSPLNTSEHNFICFVSSDNNRLYLANKYIKNTYNYAGISVSSKQKNGEWSKPKLLNIPDLYNKNEFAHYYMNINENVALMSIQRDDSYGDLDLYVSKKYGDGDWSAPKNLGSVINTVGAEGSVFLAADGKTLYFSSAGHPGFGSYDMYMSKRLDETWANWSKPLNLGAQINTEEMDIYYTIPASADYAYFSSGRTMFGMNDLYRIKLPKEIRPEFVDTKKLVASAPLKKETPITVNAELSSQKTVNTQPTTATSTPSKTITTTAPTANTQPKISTNPQTDDFQKKLDELKKQQSQITQPTATVVPQKTVAQTPTAPIVTPPTTTNREVINTVKLNQIKEEQRPKPETTNIIRPIETPKPAPKVLTPQEIAAREQQKINPTVNPNNDNLNNLTKNQMPETLKQPVKAEQEKVIEPAPAYTINEVEPTAVSAPTTSNQLLKTSNPQTDELQQKLDELKKQQSQGRINAPSNKPVNTKPTDTRTMAEQYPNPQAVLPTSNAKTDDLEQKLEALKQQQREVGQSNKIYANPYEQKPYAAQPVKEKQEDIASQDYDDYQKKLDELKKQQKSVVPTASNKPVVSSQATITSQQPVAVNTQPVVKSTPTPSTSTPNPIISKYEEKLRKLKEEMAALNAPVTITDSKLSSTPQTPTTPAVVVVEPKREDPKVETIVVENQSADKQEKLSSPVVEDAPKTENISTPITETVQPITNSTIDLEVENAKLDSIKDAQKIAAQNLDKLGTSKQDLEKDITDLQDQRTKFNDEKDKLAAQNSQLTGEKEKLELEKKKMDELLAQMQDERDKLAAEKLKMEQDKLKLEALKKQQEKEVLKLNRAIDSLGKIQQTAANNTQLQQKYDLFNVPIEVGAVAIADRIFFVADAAFLQIPSYPEMDKVVAFLKKNDKLKIEIGGHTNGLCDDAFCNKLSNDRAKTCVDYLISKGIDKNRLSYRGYGKQYLIATPGSPLNQRVEIKILSVK